MQEITEYPVQVFYDGSCSLCTAKMAFYREKEKKGRLVFVDISAPSFDATLYDMPLAAFMYEMHAIDRWGEVYRGVDAFRVIWQALPSSLWYGLLGTLVSLPGIHFLARLVYRTIAGMRKLLPKSHGACPDGTCSLGRAKASR
ncbi:putative protein [Geobacter sp. OR-1]|uniref:thiol-disulfide oxidoreductase DCC family protein n=1 Tax=Geobacter sp. OR-1 TaxID=1266765 RepID=UPI0005434680|nr:DUF393 domain-containing protein [Geobacter sp. OR-1]GAM08645.1 putative protein [Geobacter sp. OR-1]